MKSTVDGLIRIADCESLHGKSMVGGRHPKLTDTDCGKTGQTGDVVDSSRNVGHQPGQQNHNVYEYVENVVSRWDGQHCVWKQF